MDQIQCKEIERLKQPPSFEEFSQKYLTPGVPVIIEGTFTHWKANQWTLESLKETVGDAAVLVRKNTLSEDYRLGKKYDVVQMTFGSYVDRILSKNSDESGKVQSKDAKTTGGSTKSLDSSIDNFYLAVQNIRHVFPELAKDIDPLPPYIAKLHQGPFLWIAPSDHYEYTHFDPDDGVLCLLSGEKKIRLFHWNYIENLYPNPLGSKGRTIQASVDLENPDFQKNPLFREAICETGTLHPGDALFIPAFYWHQVSSTPQTISINAFCGDAGEQTFAKKVFSQRYNAVKYWLLNIIEQNRGLESFSTVISNLESALDEFFFKQWHERLQPEHMQSIISDVLRYCGHENGPPPHNGVQKKHVLLKIRGLLWRN